MQSKTHVLRIANDSVHFFMTGLTSRIVADSGIPSDRFHLGKIILQSLQDAPDFVLQIDGGSGESETSASVLRRSIRCAANLRNLGLQKGDVMVLMAPNHLDLCIPFYAALYLGVGISAIDRTLAVKELQWTFSITKPKIIFCQSERAEDVKLAVSELKIKSHIVTFDDAENFQSFKHFMDIQDHDKSDQIFKPTDFDPGSTIALLISTSGTSGNSKTAAITHQHFSMTGPYIWAKFTTFPNPTKMALLVAPLQWLTGLVKFIHAPILRFTRLQSSKPISQDHAYYLINTFKPTFAIISPTLMTTILNGINRKSCEFSSFEMILLGGSAVSKELVNELRAITPQSEVLNVYGMSEIGGMAFHSDYTDGSSGKPMGCMQYRLINVDDGSDIYDPNITGELWIKGLCDFKGYYNNPEANRESFTEDGWLKTGDLFYKDENWNFFFVDRIKSLLKYRNNQISPVEVENVIRQHPAILDVAVAGIPDPECGDLPVACVVLREGFQISAQEIKDFVKGSLSDSKQLRGGVIFMKSMPLSAATKVDRKKLKELVLQLQRE